MKTCPVCGGEIHTGLYGTLRITYCLACPWKTQADELGGTETTPTGKSAVTLTLPYPLSTNHLFFTSRDGRRVKSSAANDYRTEAGMIARMEFREPLQGRVAVHIEYAAKQGRGLDLDNVCKVSLDAMTGVAWVDDSQIDRLSVERLQKRKGGFFTVRIEEI